MAVTTITLEAYPLDSRSGLFCEACCTFALTAVRCSIVESVTLEHQRYATGSLCTNCGAEAD